MPVQFSRWFFPQISIRWKLLGAFLAMASAVLLVAFTAIELQLNATERAAVLEAEHVATAIAAGIHEEARQDNEALQRYVVRRGGLLARDIFVVDRHGVIIADTNEKAIGSNYRNSSVNTTMIDGMPRSFIGPDASERTLAKQMVVPIHADLAVPGGPSIGAVVFEYTTFYDALMDEAKKSSYMTGLAAAVLVLLGLILAVRVTRSVVEPLAALQNGVAAIAAENDTVRVAMQNRDEIATLASAFNQMAHNLGESASARGKQAHELALTNALLQKGIEAQKQAVERIEYLACHDDLTGLPNRAMFGRVLAQAIHESQRYGRPFAVFFIDLDRFKQINDTLGHHAGDLLLKEVAQRIQQSMRARDLVARLGGDEFVVLVPSLGGDHLAQIIARKILAAISNPVSIPGQELRMTSSIGISRFPKDGNDEQALMKHADIAMYQAKENGRNGFEFYDPERDGNSFERLALESSLRRALERKELVLHYQPKLDFRSGSVCGMEALLRWQHPELGMIAPAKFIPLAEETGLIVPIGLWVLRTACQQMVSWQALGLTQLVVAVNLSPRQFSDERLLMDIVSILTETGMDARLLELEITESVIMQDAARARQLLMTLKSMGVRIAIDDFGTGYSSLAMLKRLPIDTIKIDRSFIRDLATDAGDRALTETIIALGRTLKLRVVAEGVETRQQATFLRNHACDELQGFLFSKPLPAREFQTFVDAPGSPADVENPSDLSQVPS